MKRSLSFGVLVTTNKVTGEIMAAYLQIREGKAAEVREYCDGAAFANYNRHGELIGIELLAPCKLSVLTRISQDNSVKRFIRHGIPRQLELAGA
jgi:uncharacterized protein YuzE